MDFDEETGVELVAGPPPIVPFEQGIQRLRERDRHFSDRDFFSTATGIVFNLRRHESATLFGLPSGLALDPLTNVTDDLQRRRSDLLNQARGAATESIRQIGFLQCGLHALVGDQNWSGIVIWLNYLAELKVPGRDGPADAATLERPEWNATLADFCTFIRPISLLTPPPSKDPFATVPFNWLLHDITPDPSSTRLGIRPRYRAA